MKLKWKEIGGAVTPGGDPAYMCPVCFHGEHVYGVEHHEPIHKCPVCGAELIYPWEEKNDSVELIKDKKKVKEPPLAMWENAVCEIRAEIRSHDKDDTMSYAIAICDALEGSMVNFAKTGEAQDIDFDACFDKDEDETGEVIIL